MTSDLLPLLPFAFCLLPFALPFQHSEPQATLRARFVLAETGEPLTGVTVDLSSRPPAARWDQSTRSGDDGVARFEGLAAGDYQLSARKTGYLSLLGLPTVITLATNQSREDLTFRFHRQGVLSGTVTDPDGNPVSGAWVVAWRDRWEDGRRTLSRVEETTADDRGQYRLFGLSAGRYVLGAAFPGPVSPPGEVELSCKAYYPSGTQPGEAARLPVRWGQEWTDLHLVLRPYTAYSIRGVIGDSGGPCNCLLSVYRVDQGVSTSVHSGLFTPTGSFRVGGLLPGSYRLVAEKAVPGGHAVAARAVTLGNQDLTGVPLMIGPDRTVAGRIVLGSPPEALDRGKVRLGIFLLAGLRSDEPVQTEPDLTFRVRNLAPVTYRLRLAGLPEGGYFKLLRLGGQDLPAPEIEVPAEGSLGDLEVVIAFDGATLSGSVQPPESAGRGHRVTSATIALFPQENQSPYLVERRLATDSNGNFSLTAIAPGAYTVFALPAGSSLDWDDPDVRRQFARFGGSVDLGPGKKETVELLLAPVE
jgi:uncharacterized surface anchored protein